MADTLKNLLLRDPGKYFSGEEIAKMIGISRQALWKKVNILRSQGWNVEGLSGKGYRIVSTPSHVEFERIRCFLERPGFWDEIHILETVDSTNTFLLARSESGVRSAFALADAQSSGRGRMGRTWYSPPGKNIYLSLLLPLSVAPGKIPTITIVAGLSVVSVIRENLGIECQIKWPNDIYLSGKKLCGILTEMVAELDTTRLVIVGIGINVNSMSGDFPAPVRRKIISLKEYSGKDIMRVELVGLIINRLLDNLERFNEHGLEPFLDEWNRFSYLKGKTVIVDTGEEEIRGKVKGVHPTRGYLIVENEKGKEFEVISGDIAEINGG